MIIVNGEAIDFNEDTPVGYTEGAEGEGRVVRAGRLCRWAYNILEREHLGNGLPSKVEED